MIRIRQACNEDCRDIFIWRNDPQTRKSSFNSQAIPYREHLNWYHQAITDPRKKIFIGENSDGAKIGMVRFDLIDSENLEISVNVAPEYRGKGLGSRLITQASRLVEGKILATVKADNSVSIKAFIKSGYQETKNENGVVSMEYTGANQAEN